MKSRRDVFDRLQQEVHVNTADVKQMSRAGERESAEAEVRKRAVRFRTCVPVAGLSLSPPVSSARRLPARGTRSSDRELHFITRALESPPIRSLPPAATPHA